MSAAREWMTDLLPTAADADAAGYVRVRNGSYFHWEHVVPGLPWCHTECWEAPIKPALAPKPALAVGQRWRRRDGRLVTITRRITNSAVNDDGYPFRAGGHWYRADGTSCINASQVELVELIEPAAEPQPERCSTCRFAQPGWDDALRSCHHNPPQIGLRGAEWPTVNANAWCGAYERRTDG